jgi:hypothetical protein
MMRVGIIQPNFLPWRGYFDFIRSVDLFIFLDDVQYTRRDWRSRNRIKTPQGTQWLSVPVHDDGRRTLVREARIDHGRDWRHKHLGSWQANYGDAPHYATIKPLLHEIYAHEDERLVDLTMRTTRLLCGALGITTPLRAASDFAVPGAATDKLIGLLLACGATHYLSGPSAEDYLDKTRFAHCGITLQYKTYDYPPYPQLWGDFEGSVSVLDLLANCGPSAPKYLHSQSPDRRIEAHPIREMIA